MAFSLRSWWRRGAAARPAGRQPASLDEMVAEFHATVGALAESQVALSRLADRAHQTVGDLESYNRQILASISSGVVNFTAGGVCTLANPAARQILRLGPSSALLGRTAADIWGGDSALARLVEETLADPRNRSRVELRLAAPDGSDIWVGLSISILPGRGDRPRGVTLLLTDLSEVRRLRAELALKQRLAAMGELTACIAHNFRNSLATILGYATILRRRVEQRAAADDEQPEALTGPLEAIQREVREMERSIQSLLEGLSPDAPAGPPADAVDVVRGVIEGLRPEMERRRVRARCELEAGLPPVLVDAGALGQVVANLVQNSLEAMPDGGDLAVGLAGDEAGREALLTVRDTGRGIPRELVHRVFEPFFSTRKGGSGLGLALVQGTVQRYGGRVELESWPGEGTLFRLRLPLEGVVSVGR